MAYSDIIYEEKGPVAIIRMNRPETLNAITPNLDKEVNEAIASADRNAAIRAIVLTGSGKAFSSGFDIGGEVDDLPAEPSSKNMADYVTWWTVNEAGIIEKFQKWWSMGTPLIAAVNGWAMGGGFWYQLAADITLASERAVFAQPEVRHTSNTSYLFAAIAGWKAANRYGLTGDHFDAGEAFRLGLVNEVVPHDELLDRAVRLGERIARVPEPSVRLNKAVSIQGALASGLNAGLQLNAALSALAQVSHGPEREELFRIQREGGMRAFLKARDEPFLPEPFGPKSVLKRTDG